MRCCLLFLSVRFLSVVLVQASLRLVVGLGGAEGNLQLAARLQQFPLGLAYSAQLLKSVGNAEGGASTPLSRVAVPGSAAVVALVASHKMLVTYRLQVICPPHKSNRLY